MPHPPAIGWEEIGIGILWTIATLRAVSWEFTADTQDFALFTHFSATLDICVLIPAFVRILSVVEINEKEKILLSIPVKKQKQNTNKKIPEKVI